MSNENRENTENQVSNAMWIYPLTEENKENLLGCEFVKAVKIADFKEMAFVFNDPYRKLNVDLIVTRTGEIYISDFYGETMDRKTIFYVICRE